VKISTIDDQVPAREDLERVVGVESEIVSHDFHVRIEPGYCRLRRVHLGFSDGRGVVQDLAVEIRHVHGVAVDEAQLSDPCRG
jgi:hypothetical protein